MLTITVERDSNLYVAVWDDGDLAGDEALVDTVDAMIEAGIEVDVTPTGPRVQVSKATPQTIIRALEDFGAVSFQGDLPDLPGSESEDVDY